MRNPHVDPALRRFRAVGRDSSRPGRARGTWVVGALAVVSTLAATAGAGSASATTSSAGGSTGVTATTIRIGIPYVDLSAVRQFGIKLDQGNYPDAYNALIANINAHGGIDGRHLVPYLVAVNPVGTAPAATACTQLAEDDKVFVAIAPQQPDCFLQQYKVPTITGTFQDVTGSASAPNFTLTPPPIAYDPVQLAAFARQGVFKGKTVGLFAGGLTDQPELNVARSTLARLHVKVADAAVDSAPTTDQSAVYQQQSIIAQRFESSHVDEVVAVGTGSLIWPDALAANQSTYHPSWVATSQPSLETGVLAASIPSAYLKNVLTSSPIPSNYQIWHTPAVQQCARIVRKAYPSDKMTPPTNPISGSDQTFYSVEAACTNLALFTTIAKAAGKDLTLSSFAKAGYGLRHVTIAGAATPVSFGANRPYPLGTVIPVTYEASKNVLQFANAPVAS